MNRDECVGFVKQAMRQSELVRAVNRVRQDDGLAFALEGEPALPLSEEQIGILQRAGNSADDWSHVRVAAGFNPRRVQRCTFFGCVLLGRFDEPAMIDAATAFPSGVYNSTLVDCAVGHDALVRDTSLLRGYVLAPRCAVWDAGVVSAGAGTSFGIGQELSLAIESGGREVPAFPEITVEFADALTRSRRDGKLVDCIRQAVRDYVHAARSPRGIIQPGAVVRHTGRVENTYVGASARIENAVAVVSSTLLSSEAEPACVADGALVEQSALQWGSVAQSGAIVQRAVLTEHSHVSRHGILTDSILGPNSGVAEGEVTASLVGPFVGFHHQALLIAALWPGGKGNVAYGANVGSNHTSKAPDQELWVGEGMFFGLGVNVKFPADYTGSPYSILAPGISTLPQKLAFPFSLINSPSGTFTGISPAYNELFPAWLLTDNLYTLRRNEGKYAARNKARRTQLEFAVFRPDTIDLMRDARRRLQEVSQFHDVYTECDIPGLGKNYLREPNRIKAIEAYDFHVAYYALVQLKDHVQHLAANTGKPVAAGLLLEQPSNHAVWEHARATIAGEAAGANPWIDPGDTAAALLARLVEMQTTVADAVEQSKAKDDRRGARIIDDYAAAHTAAEADEFVRRTRAEAEAFQHEIDALIARLA